MQELLRTQVILKSVVVHSLSRVWLFVTPWTTAHQASLPFTISWSQLKLVSIESMMPFNYPTTLSSVGPFSFCLQSFQASGSFLRSQFFASGSQSIGTSASASVFPMNIQGWFPLGLTGLISLQPKGLSRVFSNTTVQSINCSAFSFLYGPTVTSVCDYWKNQ